MDIRRLVLKYPIHTDRAHRNPERTERKVALTSEPTSHFTSLVVCTVFRVPDADLPELRLKWLSGLSEVLTYSGTRCLLVDDLRGGKSQIFCCRVRKKSGDEKVRMIDDLPQGGVWINSPLDGGGALGKARSHELSSSNGEILK